MGDFKNLEKKLVADKKIDFLWLKKLWGSVF